MKRFTSVALMAMGLAAAGMAADYQGFVEDAKCSTMAGMKGNANCAKSCIKGGSAAVLVTSDGTVYKIANQDKITDYAGQNVSVKAELKDGALTVSEVKAQ